MQLVTNTFKVYCCKWDCLRKPSFISEQNEHSQGMRQLRLHMLAALGYCVVTIDSRGSQNRGVKFESHIKGRMVSKP